MTKIKFLNKIKENQKGFTLVETLVAVLILALCIDAVITLAAGGLFVVRYSKNNIIANNLAQEGLEYIRYSRDTYLQSGFTVNNWINNVISDCFTTDGCIVDPHTIPDGTSNFDKCIGPCLAFQYYPNSAFYGYNDISHVYPSRLNKSGSYLTTFTRKITFSQPLGPSNNLLHATVEVTWMDGLNKKTFSQTMVLTSWKENI